jgi:hypothetical protein
MAASYMAHIEFASLEGQRESGAAIFVGGDPDETSVSDHDLPGQGEPNS